MLESLLYDTPSVYDRYHMELSFDTHSHDIKSARIVKNTRYKNKEIVV